MGVQESWDPSAGPVAEGGGLPSSGGLPSGGSPGEAKMFKYRKIWRHTRLGGIDYSIGICLQCRDVIEPVGKRRSRKGTHGEDFFIHEHELRFVELYQSNSGNRDFMIDGGLEFLEDLVDTLWIYYRESPETVEEKIAEKLKEG
jgi:hypothetical protein